MMLRSGRFPSAMFASCLLLAALVLSGPSPYTAPTGDVNGDGGVDALDIQCTVLVYEALEGAGPVDEDLCGNDGDCPPNSYCRVGFGPGKQCLPVCLAQDVDMGLAQAVLCMDEMADNPLCKGKTAKKNADLNCDGLLGNEDFVFMVAVVVDKLGLPTSPDFDDDGKLNGCDDDSDGDSIPDALEGTGDTDADQGPDYLDLDADDDGIPDAQEGAADIDGDGKPNFQDLDSDGDGDPDSADCAPLDADNGAGLMEICDQKDNDCDGETDEGGVCAPVGPACLDDPPNPLTGQGCPLYTPCQEFDDCGVFQDCQQWYCWGGVCVLNALTDCWDNVGGGCNANIVFQQHANPPVDKDFLVPDANNFRRLASIAFTVTNNTSQDWYLSEIPLQLDASGGGSKYDVDSVSVYDNSGGAEYDNESFVCWGDNPFGYPANGQITGCTNWNSRIPKNGGSNMFIVTLDFAKGNSWIGGRSYRLKIAGTAGFAFGSTSFGGDTFTGTMCGVPAGGYIGAWLNAKDEQ